MIPPQLKTLQEQSMAHLQRTRDETKVAAYKNHASELTEREFQLLKAAACAMAGKEKMSFRLTNELSLLRSTNR